MFGSATVPESEYMIDRMEQKAPREKTAKEMQGYRRYISSRQVHVMKTCKESIGL